MDGCWGSHATSYGGVEVGIDPRYSIKQGGMHRSPLCSPESVSQRPRRDLQCCCQSLSSIESAEQQEISNQFGIAGSQVLFGFPLLFSTLQENGRIRAFMCLDAPCNHGCLCGALIVRLFIQRDSEAQMLVCKLDEPRVRPPQQLGTVCFAVKVKDVATLRLNFDRDLICRVLDVALLKLSTARSNDLHEVASALPEEAIHGVKVHPATTASCLPSKSWCLRRAIFLIAYRHCG